VGDGGDAGCSRGIFTPVGGGGGGRLKGNRHIVAKDTPTANLLLALAHVGGAEIDSLGPSTGRVDL